MMVDREAFENPTLDRLLLYVYFVPIFGLVPAVWTISRRQGDRQHRQMSRLSVALGGAWLLGMTLLSWPSEGNPQLSMMLLNSALTSGYFLTALWLMRRLWKRQSVQLPGLSAIAKYLP